MFLDVYICVGVHVYFVDRFCFGFLLSTFTCSLTSSFAFLIDRILPSNFKDKRKRGTFDGINYSVVFQSKQTNKQTNISFSMQNGE